MIWRKCQTTCFKSNPGGIAKLPSVDEFFKIIGILSGAPHKLVVKMVNSIIQTFRNHILSGKYDFDLLESIYEIADIELKKIYSSNLKSIINGTGIVLHTGLGEHQFHKV